MIRLKEFACVVFPISFAVFLLISCGGGSSGGSAGGSIGSGTSTEITVSGSFTGGTHAKSTWLNRAFASLTPKAFALNPGQVAKVLIFEAGRYSYQSATVTNGTFSIRIGRGKPVGMIFVGSNNEYLGYLNLKNGIQSIPISRVKSNIFTIDLGVLSSSGLVVEPSNNPLGNEIPLTGDELKALAHFNGLFASIVRNPDIDGNGVIDVLEGKKYFLQIGYQIYPGNFGGNLTPSFNNFTIRQYQIYFFSNTSNCPSTVIVTGPQGSPFETPTTVNRVQIGSYCTHQFISPDYPTLPGAGEYKVQYSNEILTFNIPDQSPILSGSIIMLPTIKLNGDGTIQKISWVYRLASGSGEPVNPESLIENILINRTVAGVAAPTVIIPSTSVTELDLSDKGIIWDQVDLIGTCFDDVYGNIYGIWWEK